MKNYDLMWADFEVEKPEITLAGWNLDNAEVEIKQIIEEHIDEEIIIKKIEKREVAYSCSRYYEEQDARDEGHSYWFLYHNEWKKGLGKCSKFEVEYSQNSSKGEKQK